MEILNLAELRVWSTSLTPISGDITLDNLMGLTTLGWGSGGDISCLYDYDNGGHWFITEIVTKTPDVFGSPGAFVGCFAGVLNTCLEGIAVSVTNNPLGAYNVYFLDPNTVNSDPGKGYLLNDFDKIGNTRDAFLLFYDEFNFNCLIHGICPTGFGSLGFNGAQQFAFSKRALELGFPTSSAFFNVAYENMGTDPALYPIPANPPFQPSAADCTDGVHCWFADIPAQSPDPTQYDNSYGGSGFMIGSLDFQSFIFGTGTGDNRIGAFDWTGLSNLNSLGCSTCASILFGSQILGPTSPTIQPYVDGERLCPASTGGSCSLAAQKTGPTPLGDLCSLLGLTQPCPESGIATNGDFFTQASFAGGNIWSAIPTLITQTYEAPASNEIHVGVAYWVIGAASFDSTGIFSLTQQGYVTAEHEDIEFPSIAAAGSKAVMVFSLSGDGGPTSADGGGFFPSTAYGLLTTHSQGLSPKTIHIADLGMSPQDGFTQYFHENRWGDYTQGIFVPSLNRVYFSTEYIQSPNCSDTAFSADPSCGGTRDPFANWGSSVNFVTP